MKIWDIVVKWIKHPFEYFTKKDDPVGEEDVDRVKIDELKKMNDEKCKNNPFEVLTKTNIGKISGGKKKKWETIK